MSWSGSSSLRAWIAFGALALAGCANPTVEGTAGTDPPDETPPGSAGSTGAGMVALPGIPPGGAGGASGSPAMGAAGSGGLGAGDMTCAAQAFTPKEVPVDIHILFDSSLSMDRAAGDRSKWERAVLATNAFVTDPKSVDLGVGLTFYPNRTPTNVNTCRIDYYTTPAVTLAPLPMNQAALTAAINQRQLCCDTPTRPAMEGTLMYLRSHAMMNPDRRPILLLITDGLPNGCGPGNTIESIAEFLTAARTGSPSINTYAIGVFSDEDRAEGEPALNSWATAGGSGMPFVLSATEDLGQKLLDALNEIRGSALGCQFAVPDMPGIDFLKVNVRVQSGSGMEEIPYVGSADRCDPTSGGWHYDVDPTTAAPTRVVVCDATCRKYKLDPAAKVDLLFGCKTRTID